MFVLRYCFENAIRRGLAWFLWRINCFLSLFTALINIHLADACVLLQCSAFPSRAARDIDELWVWGCSNHTAIRPHHGFCGQNGARSTLRYISPAFFLTGHGFPQPLARGNSRSKAALLVRFTYWWDALWRSLSSAQGTGNLVQHRGVKQHPASGGTVQRLVRSRTLPARGIRWEWDCESLKMCLEGWIEEAII